MIKRFSLRFRKQLTESFKLRLATLCVILVGSFIAVLWWNKHQQNNVQELSRVLQELTNIGRIDEMRMIKKFPPDARMPGHSQWIVVTESKIQFPENSVSIPVRITNDHAWYEGFYETRIAGKVSERYSTRWETDSDEFRVSSIVAGNLYYYMIQSSSASAPAKP